MESRLRAFFDAKAPEEAAPDEAIYEPAVAEYSGDLERDFRNLEGCYVYLLRKVHDMDMEMDELRERQRRAILGFTTIALATLGVTLLSLLSIMGII